MIKYENAGMKYQLGTFAQAQHGDRIFREIVEHDFRQYVEAWPFFGMHNACAAVPCISDP